MSWHGCGLVWPASARPSCSDRIEPITFRNVAQGVDAGLGIDAGRAGMTSLAGTAQTVSAFASSDTSESERPTPTRAGAIPEVHRFHEIAATGSSMQAIAERTDGNQMMMIGNRRCMRHLLHQVQIWHFQIASGDRIPWMADADAASSTVSTAYPRGATARSRRETSFVVRNQNSSPTAALLYRSKSSAGEL
jgi:hypothetical protein